MTRSEAVSRPVTTLDFDGVICNPPFGRNIGISRTFLDPAADAIPARVPPRWLSVPGDYLRFNFRRPLPGVREALASLGELRTIVILTGRRNEPGRWLRRYHMDGLVDRVVVNDTMLRSPHFKLRLVEELGAAEHVDDDGRTAQLLAQRSSVRVYLRDWPRNRDLELAPGVTRVADLTEFVGLITAEAIQSSSPATAEGGGGENARLTTELP
jgi:hypothetical protein